MHRRKLAAALAAVTATALIAPPAQAAATQEIQWRQCFGTVPPGFPPGSERLECGSFTAPMDWNNPNNGKTITIAVSRLRPKNGTAKSTVFTNPGGPGGPGRTMPLIYLDRPKLSENAEIIGIDVRGTGASSNVTCGNVNPVGVTDPRDRSRANLDLLYGAVELQAEFCQTKSGELGRYVTTDQTLKDLDLLRQVLGKKKVSWLGYSGGSWMGAYYATYFPKTLDRIVLDSNAEFTGPWQGVFDDWGMGFERRFRVDFLPWVAKYDNVFHLGKTGEEVRQAYERTRAKLAEQPVTRPEGVYYPVTLDLLLRGSIYDKYNFAGAAQTLAELAGAVPAQLTAQASYPDAQAGTAYSIVCNDMPFRGDRRYLERDAARDGAKWPLVGYYQIMAPCAFWDRPNVQLKRPTGIGVATTLMVQSVRDPATPLEGAQKAHRNFNNSVLLTVEDEGDHGIYGFGNECVNDIVERYLVDGVAPTKDLTCPGVPLPVPGETAKNSLTRTRELATQLGW
ncbi:alpha/beta hydrolase family protein [Lentzea atacamensis]|uniref:Alpha/beta hydrolase family protein n=1 Tax=Lentzea atacamensis TaxID=531938 RepID=A0A316I9T0_9PSEU|nr:alpha/beta hydrolase [Lentzea atacamensis]PWK89383.1 alpha/beta hydrolase family protein [Lentzea atacamensis]